MRAELRSAKIGLMIAWDMSYKKVHLQLDSLAAVTTILGNQEEKSRHGQTLDTINELRNRNWEVTISHIFTKATESLIDFGFHVNSTLSQRG
ncbi:hypothetical protein LINPERHAP1_LOCUS24967 [Linum perenne]